MRAVLLCSLLLATALCTLLLATACNTGREVLREAGDARGLTSTVALKVVTFNVQDLFVASDREQRMRAIGRALGRLRPDLVGLQEAFDATHREELKTELERVSGATYESVYFPSGVMGSGLCVLTPHKIERAVFWRYSQNGAWYQYKHGDFYAGKGAAMVRIAVEGGGAVDCFNTHCIASYPGASYRADRTVQLQELVAFVDAEATTSAPAILLGDLNARVDSPEYAPLSTSFDNLTVRLNPEAVGRIDHILVRPHPSYVVRARDYAELSIGLDDDGEELVLSDHDGVVITLELQPSR